MAEKRPDAPARQPGDEADRQGEAQSEYMKGGKGRKDEVGKSGIYPASSPDAPGDAVFRAEADLVGHAGAASTPRKNRGARKGDSEGA